MDTPNPQVGTLAERIEKLEKANAELRNQNAEKDDELAFLKKENKRLLGELRKYLNENLTSPVSADFWEGFFDKWGLRSLGW